MRLEESFRLSFSGFWRSVELKVGTNAASFFKAEVFVQISSKHW
jgi:hypothetical protein